MLKEAGNSRQYFVVAENIVTIAAKTALNGIKALLVSLQYF